MKSTSLYRLGFIYFGLIIFALVLGFKLYTVQILAGDEYSQKAGRQFFRTDYYSFDRGKIYFQERNKNLISAAEQKSGFVLGIDPNQISNPDETYQKITSVISLDRDHFDSRVERDNTTYQEIARRLDIEQREALGALSVPGLMLHREQWRFYPGDNMASHTLGFLGFQGDELAGRYGLERSYQDVLVTQSDEAFVNFFAEVFLNVRDSFSDSSRETGDIITTIEPLVQRQLEKTLEETKGQWRAEHTGAVIVDPKNGKIKAIASNPDFNPNAFGRESDLSIFTNPLVENVFEMGSTIKPLTIAAGLDSGAITPHTTYFDHGFVVLDSSTIFNFDGESRGEINIQGALNNSLNTGMAFIVSQMGKNRFAEYMMNFGLGEKTEIDLPNETAGLTENLKSPRELEYATASFGQGIALTPIATVRALSALANGGTLVTPHLVERIDYRGGSSKEIVREEGRRVIKPETSEEITRMLVNTVDEALLGGSVKMTNYSIAAKTGTAQIPRSDERGYYEDRFFHSFFGYFPAYDPEFLIFLYAYDPKGVRYASETLTHPFMDLTKFLINYYEIPPDR